MRFDRVGRGFVRTVVIVFAVKHLIQMDNAFLKPDGAGNEIPQGFRHIGPGRTVDRAAELFQANPVLVAAGLLAGHFAFVDGTLRIPSRLQGDPRAATEVELKERKHRIEDAVRNAKAAVEEGIVAGGGVALLQSAPSLEELKLTGDEATGANIVRVALSAPLKQIALNGGLEPGVVAEKVTNLPAGHGLNAATGEYEDLLKAGVADPVKVTRSALQNAASIAALFLTTEAVVADKPEKAAAPAGDPTGGMGGMDF